MVNIPDKVSASVLDTSFRTNFMKKLQALKERKVEDVANGVENYQYYVGYIRAITEISEMAEDLRKELLEI